MNRDRWYMPKHTPPYHVPKATPLYRSDGQRWSFILTTKAVTYDAADLLNWATYAEYEAINPNTVELRQIEAWIDAHIQNDNFPINWLFFRLPSVAHPYIMVVVSQASLKSLPWTPSPQLQELARRVAETI